MLYCWQKQHLRYWGGRRSTWPRAVPSGWCACWGRTHNHPPTCSGTTETGWSITTLRWGSVECNLSQDDQLWHSGGVQLNVTSYRMINYDTQVGFLTGWSIMKLLRWGSVECNLSQDDRLWHSGGVQLNVTSHRMINYDTLVGFSWMWPLTGWSIMTLRWGWVECNLSQDDQLWHSGGDQLKSNLVVSSRLLSQKMVIDQNSIWYSYYLF